MKRAGVLMASLISLALLAPASALAIEVNATTDGSDPTPNDGICGDGGGNCTLRAAIETSQGTLNPGSDTITFGAGLASPIELTSGLPTITQGLEITGPGAASLAVDGNGVAARIFEVSSTGTVTIFGMTITGGLNAGSSGSLQASGMRNFGSTTLDRVVVTNNSTQATGTATNLHGGGIYNGGVSLIIRDSTVSGNFATLSLNGASANGDAYGGGIYNNNAGSPTGELRIERSTISGNVAGGTASPTAGTSADVTGRGGGLYNSGVSYALLDRATVSGNIISLTAVTAPGNPGIARGSGGGIADEAVGTRTVELRSSTVTGNRVFATSGQPAITDGSNLDPGPSTNAGNTIVSEAGGSLDNCADPVGSVGFNLEGDALAVHRANSCGFSQPGDQNSVSNTGLDPTLADNGGPTLTHKLNAGSIAIDKGKTSAGETTDQRGLGRPSDFAGIANAAGGDGSDVGAFELQAPAPPAPPQAAPVTTSPTAAATENPECATLRERLKRLNKKIKRADDRENKRKLKKKRRKIRRQLAELGCAT
jgi:hypothetical protein